MLDEFRPDVIGIRTLSFYKEFFHKTITMIRNWGFEGMSAMKADIARAIKILELDEKVILALSYSGHIFYEITRVVRKSKKDTTNIYRSGLIRILMYLNGPL